MKSQLSMGHFSINDVYIITWLAVQLDMQVRWSFAR